MGRRNEPYVKAGLHLVSDHDDAAGGEDIRETGEQQYRVAVTGSEFISSYLLSNATSYTFQSLSNQETIVLQARNQSKSRLNKW